jgi:RNA polymerase sigma-70 factor (ECF subfamily)
VDRLDDAELTGWALRAGCGDRVALENFIRATQRDVWRFVAHFADLQSADDLVQETYLRALGSLPRFAARSSARTWLLSIARRVVIDQVRMARVRPGKATGVDWLRAAEVSQAAQRRTTAGFEEIVEVNLLLAALDADRRDALVLTQVLGLSYAEAAQVCGCPVGTIRSRVARAREELIRAVGGEEPATGAG